MKHHTTLLLFFALFAILLTACGGSKQTVAPPAASTQVETGCIPGWFLNPEEDSDYIYAAAEGTSPLLQTAISIAEQNCRQRIALQIEANVQAMVRNFTDQTGTAEDPVVLQQFQDVSQTVTEQMLYGAKARERVQCKEGKLYHGYVLMSMPVGAVKERFLESLRKEAELKTRFEAERSFQQLAEEVKAYRQSKAGS